MQSRYYKDIAPTELSSHRVIGMAVFLFLSMKLCNATTTPAVCLLHSKKLVGKIRTDRLCG